jgi:hypothetical protein
MFTEILGFSVLFVFFMAIIIGVSKILDELLKSDDPWK